MWRSRGRKGWPRHFFLGRDFIGPDHVALVLGDNIFYGQGFQRMLHRAAAQPSGATLFAYAVKDPQRATASSSWTPRAGPYRSSRNRSSRGRTTL